MDCYAFEIFENINEIIMYCKALNWSFLFHTMKINYDISLVS
jgi:hypothetical protein